MEKNGNFFLLFLYKLEKIEKNLIFYLYFFYINIFYFGNNLFIKFSKYIITFPANKTWGLAKTNHIISKYM